jgi:hypothetical protein
LQWAAPRGGLPGGVFALDARFFFSAGALAAADRDSPADVADTGLAEGELAMPSGRCAVSDEAAVCA